MAIRGPGLHGRRARATVAVSAVAIGMLLMSPGGPSAASAPTRSPGSLFYESQTSTGILVIDRVLLSAPRRSREVVEVGNVGVFGIAIGGRHVYWSFEAGPRDQGKIMRASLDGRHVRPLVGELAAPDSVIAVKGFVYWSDRNAIGRVALDGSHLRRRFLVLPQETGGGVADGLASDGSHLYFSRCTQGTIGRADLSGSGVITAFISTGQNSCPQGLAVAGRHLYWTELGSGTIGRADLDGRNADDGWLNVRSRQGPFQVVADRAHVYWTWGGVDGSPAYTARADADGSHLDLRFLTDSLYPMALSSGATGAA
jgi:hypothetical protein